MLNEMQRFKSYREIPLKFSFQVDILTLHHKREASERLRNDLQSPLYDDIITEKFIFIDIPRAEDHSDHSMGDVRFILALSSCCYIGRVQQFVFCDPYQARLYMIF